MSRLFLVVFIILVSISGRDAISQEGHSSIEDSSWFISAGLGGGWGYWGAEMGYYFSPTLNLALRSGGDDQYLSRGLRLKKLFLYDTFSPYLALEWAQWRGDGSKIEKTRPNFLLKNFLDADERATGNFQEDIILLSIGTHWRYRKWPKGLSLFGENSFLINTDNDKGEISGSLGLSWKW